MIQAVNMITILGSKVTNYASYYDVAYGQSQKNGKYWCLVDNK